MLWKVTSKWRIFLNNYQPKKKIEKLKSYRKKIKLIIRDVNARVGEENGGHKIVIGKEVERKNHNGTKIFLRTEWIVNWNSISKYKNIHKKDGDLLDNI